MKQERDLQYKRKRLIQIKFPQFNSCILDDVNSEKEITLFYLCARNSQRNQSPYWLIARYVMAAVLVVRNNKKFLLWELTSIFMQTM